LIIDSVPATVRGCPLRVDLDGRAITVPACAANTDPEPIRGLGIDKSPARRPCSNDGGGGAKALLIAENRCLRSVTQPGPTGTWQEFLTRHASDIWACVCVPTVLFQTLAARRCLSGSKLVERSPRHLCSAGYTIFTGPLLPLGSALDRFLAEVAELKGLNLNPHGLRAMAICDRRIDGLSHQEISAHLHINGHGDALLEAYRSSAVGVRSEQKAFVIVNGL